MAVVLVPVASDKAGPWKAFAEELTGPKKAEFSEFNARYQLTKHEAWWCETQAGYFVVAIHEGAGADSFLKKLGASNHKFDTWFRDKLQDIHHMDLSKPPPGPMPIRKI